MANKKINQLDSRSGASLSDLSLVGDPINGVSYKLTLTQISTLMGVPGKFNQPTGTTSQYLRGDGSLATFPTITSGTVTSVDMSVPTGLTISGNPITGSGTLALALASGYTIPTQALLDGKVPYIGATGNVDLGEYELKAGQLTLDVSPTGTAAVGTTRWNNTIGISETTLNGGTVVLKNGVDLVVRVVNKVSPNATLTKAAYQAVRVTGAQGQRLAVAYAQANNDNNSADTIGLVCETIATNQEGFIITVGQLENINTTGSLQGETWNDGDVLYLSPTTPGAITNIKPAAPQHLVVIGYVEYAHANNGKIYVKVMNGWELGELHDVNTTGAVNGNVLKYNGSIWVPSSDIDTGITSINGLTALSQTFATGTTGTDFNIGSAGSTHTFNIPSASATNRGALTSADFITFNNKQNAGNYITALTGEVTASGPGSAAATLLNSAVIGKVLTGLNLTGGGTILATDSILQAFGKTQNQISALVGGVMYEGVWNASTNTPAIVSGVGSKGDYYVVNVAGSTNIDGISDWKVGDWIIFNGTNWDKVDNTDAVSSVNGFTGAVSLTTANISEVTNLYFTDARVMSAMLTGYTIGSNTAITFNDSVLTAFGKAQAQINTKQNIITLTTTGSSGSATLVSDTLNVPTYTLAGLGGQPQLNGTGFVKATGTTITYDNSTYALDSAVVHNTGTETVAGAKTFTSAVTSTNFVLSGGTGNTGLYYGHTNKVVLANYTVGGGIDFETNGGAINMVLDASANLSVVGNVTASSLIKSGGTSSQFLKADGSVDSSTYYLASNPSAYIALTALTASAPLSYNNTTGAFTIAQASGSVSGYLSSTDWTTFNNKQNALTNPVTGTGTTNYLPKWTSGSVLGNSLVYDDGTNIGIGTATPSHLLHIQSSQTGTTQISNVLQTWRTNASGRDITLQFSDGTNQAYISSLSGNLCFATNGANERLRITSGGNLLVNSITDSGERLQVSGDILSKAATGNTAKVSLTSGIFNSYISAVDGNRNMVFVNTSTINLGDNISDIRFCTNNNTTTPALKLAITGAATFSSSVTASSFIKSGGTSSQYLMADGSVTTGSALTITNRQTASYTLALTDADKLVEMNVATANNLTVPLNSSVAFAIGTKIDLAQYGAGQTTVVATSGVTVRSAGGALKLALQYSGASLVKIGTNEWYLFGDITV